MATTRELAEAHAYENRRQATGLFRGADEALRDPRRRVNRALAGGVAMGVLIMAGFGIAGWLGGGRGPKLPQNGAVVVGGSGDRYVVSEGTVHPALNLASALLVGGGRVTEVRQAALDEAPRGLPVGIPAAPDALPGEGDLSAAPWTVCTVPATDTERRARTYVYVALPEAAPASGTAPSATVLAQAPGGTLWLLDSGRRYRISEGVAATLGLQRAQRVPLPDALLATVPEAPAIDTPEADEGGEPAAELGVEATVGDVVHSDLNGVNPQYYTVRPDGLVAVSELVYTLLRATDVAEHELTPVQAAEAPRSDAPAPGDPAWPERLPDADRLDRNRPLCVTTPTGSAPGDAPWEAVVHLPGRLPEPAGLSPVAPADGTTLGIVTGVYVQPGRGALVRATASAGAGGTYTLVTDGGTAYPLATAEAVERLRYTPADAPTLPAAYVGLLPRGPVLDPRAAAVEHQGDGRTGAGPEPEEEADASPDAEQDEETGESGNSGDEERDESAEGAEEGDA
ncbi:MULTISPECIES: type VII secretion protein EccB [unclassified Streptomyces]|uniref:type VII secretion protein EccB n=1 Tax=unclassified Streptomyces TaxID=2593676 RepID=UPI0022B6CCBE|nr:MULTISPECIES: type VII secretion protein EccB [unclassified Streptomyces]MCZ7413892.1 type VII secretion protein EccB [Streptomyces sp. WMMC897]MCZ7430888.1 type VII secretion protein EccB [Streptomyces sp. WMMC1477]